jgi:hypothetical protein
MDWFDHHPSKLLNYHLSNFLLVAGEILTRGLFLAVAKYHDT